MDNYQRNSVFNVKDARALSKVDSTVDTSPPGCPDEFS